MNLDRLVRAKLLKCGFGLIVCGLSVGAPSRDAAAGSGTALSSDAQLSAAAAEAASTEPVSPTWSVRR